MWWKLYVAVFYILTFHGLCKGDEETSLKIVTKSTVYNLGETKAIYCEATKSTGNRLDWISNNGTIVQDKGPKNTRIHVDRTKNDDMIALFIRSAQLIDNGNWTCISGDISNTTTILVGDKVHIPIRYQNLGAKEGETIKLDCLAKGSPEPVIQWYKEMTPIEEDSAKYRLNRIKDNYQLEIRRLDYDDTGDYECRVTQEQLSYYTNKNIHLDVRHKPILINPDSDEIYTEARAIEAYAILNETKNLTCKVLSNPSPNYKWTKKIGGYEREITGEDIIYISPDGLFSVLMLRLYNESYLGQYTCSAKNDHGRVTLVYDVSAGTKPMPPHSVEWMKANSTTMWFNVNCTECNFNIPEEEQTPENLPVIEYQFQFTRVIEDTNIPDWDEAYEISVPIIMANETIFEVGPLPNSTKFHARLRSKNSAGYSEWFDIINSEMATTDFAIKLIASITLVIMSLLSAFVYF